MIHVYAEYESLFQVCSVAKHIKGIKIKTVDDIYYVQELFVPRKTHIYDVSFNIFLAQVCQNHKKFKSWDIFLPSRQLLSQMRSTVSSDFPTVQLKVTKAPGHCTCVNSILSSSTTTKTYGNIPCKKRRRHAHTAQKTTVYNGLVSVPFGLMKNHTS